jgi:two-component system chemotaxis response regulator CheB
MDAFRDSLNAKVRLAVSARRRPLAHARPAHVNGAAAQTRSKVARAVVIATSTGGPRALAALLPRLPARLGLGTLIVQHMPAGFTESLASRLDQRSQLRVREAAGGERLEPGTALLAPGGKHLRLSGDAITQLTEEPAVGGLRPRADLLIEDAARIYRERLLLVVLTGMGNDGLRGATAVRRHGGRILAEAEETCTIYGMPRAIVDGGLADEVLSLDRLASVITAEAGL